MSTRNPRNAGRPRVLTTEEKKDIVNRYLISVGQDVSVLKQYGLYERLAQFAKSMDQKFSVVRHYHFSTDNEIKAYISQLANSSLSQEAAGQLVGCVYTALDFTVVERMIHTKRYPELISLLRNREESLRDMYEKVSNAMARYNFILSKYSITQEALDEQEKTLNALQAEIDRLNSELKKERKALREKQAENSTLRRTVDEQTSRLAVKAHDALIKSLGANDNIATIVSRETKKLVEEHLDEAPESKQCKIIRLCPNLEED